MFKYIFKHPFFYYIKTVKILTILIAFFSTNIIISQGILYNENNEPLLNSSSKYPSGQVSLGFGFAKGILYDSDEERLPFMALVSVNADQQLYKILYFGLGLDAYKDPQEGRAVLIGLNLRADFRITTRSFRHSFWAGIGALTNFYSNNRESEMIFPFSLGVIFSLRYEYNIDGLYSVGLEIKHPIYITYNRSPKVIMVNLYGSVSIF